MNLAFYKQPNIVQTLEKNGLRVFTRPFELNIIGVRSSNQLTNKFDDVLHVCYQNEVGQWVQHIYACTTDPGSYFIYHPMNASGTALLKQGQYVNAYQLGLHRGKYKAIVQRKPVTVYRSSSKTLHTDERKAKIQTGLFGINIHHAKGDGTTDDVNRWSAGCQVIANINDFKELMRLAEKHANQYGNQFTYTLLDYRTKGYVAQQPFKTKETKTEYEKTEPKSSAPMVDTDLPNAMPTPSDKTGLLLLGTTALVGLGTGIYYFTKK